MEVSRAPTAENEGVAITASDAAQYLASAIPESSIYEPRIQGMVFAAAINWNEQQNRPFTNATFRRVRRAVFAQEIRDQVETWRSKPTFPQPTGDRIPKYDIKFADADVSSFEGENPEAAVELLDAVIEEFGDLDRKEIMNWCTEQPEVADVYAGQDISL